MWLQPRSSALVESHGSAKIKNICLFANKPDKTIARNKMYRLQLWKQDPRFMTLGEIKILQRCHKFFFFLHNWATCKPENVPCVQAREKKMHTMTKSIAAPFQLNRVVANAASQPICNSLLLIASICFTTLRAVALIFNFGKAKDHNGLFFKCGGAAAFSHFFKPCTWVEAVMSGYSHCKKTKNTKVGLLLHTTHLA